MKIICLILSLYVIILSAKPCCTDNDCVALAKEKTSKQAPNEKGCFGCSPFFTCGSCVGFVTGKPVVVSLPMIEESVVNDMLHTGNHALQKCLLLSGCPLN